MSNLLMALVSTGIRHITFAFLIITHSTVQFYSYCKQTCFLCPAPPLGGGIKRWCTSDVCRVHPASQLAACACAAGWDGAYWLIGPSSAGLAQGCHCMLPLLHVGGGAHCGSLPYSLLMLSNSLYLSLSLSVLTAIFQVKPGLAGVYWSKGWWRWWWQLAYWSDKLCKAPVKSSPPTNHHPVVNVV